MIGKNAPTGGSIAAPRCFLKDNETTGGNNGGNGDFVDELSEIELNQTEMGDEEPDYSPSMRQETTTTQEAAGAAGALVNAAIGAA